MKKLCCLLIPVVVLAVGCNGKKLNLDEAQNIALAYEGESFTPPSRSLDELIEQIQLAREEPRFCRVCQENEDLPDINEKLKVLSHKAIASARLGDTRYALQKNAQALNTLEQALKDNQWVQWKPRYMVYHRAMQVVESLGRYSTAIEYGLKSVEAMGSDNKGKAGTKVYVYSALAHHYSRLGDIDKADDALDEVERQFSLLAAKKGEKHRYWAMWNGARSYAKAHVAQAQGDLRQAEVDFREAVQWFGQKVQDRNIRQHEMAVEAQGLYLVEVLLEQGRVAEAELESRQAIKQALNFFGKNSPATASAIMGLTKVMLKRGRYQDALTLAQISDATLRSIKATPESSYFMQNVNLMAEAQLALGDYSAALATFESNEKAGQSDPKTLKIFIDVNLDYAVTLMKSGDLEKATSIATNAVKFRQRMLGDGHPAVKEAQALELIIQAKRSQRSNLDRVAPLLIDLAAAAADDSSDQIGSSNTQNRFRIMVDEVLEMNHASPAAADTLFQLAQLGRGQMVQKALSASALRSRVGNPELLKLIRQEQDISFKVDSVYNALVRHDEADNTAATLKAATDLRAALNRLREEIDDRFPEYANLTRPTPVTLAQLRASLKPGEALVSFYFSADQGYVWAVTAAGQQEFVTLETTAKRINEQVKALRSALNSNARTITEVPEFDTGVAHQLYQTILSPVARVIENAKSLIVIPDGQLASLPLGVLVTKTPPSGKDKEIRFDHYRGMSWLANRFDTSYLPSEKSLLTLRNMPAAKPGRKLFAGFGNPLYGQAQAAPKTMVTLRNQSFNVRGLRKTKSGDLDDKTIASTTLDQLVPLPETENEVMQVANALGADPGDSVFVKQRASEDVVKSTPLNDRQIIMFATHALVPGDLDGLDQPALAMSSPTDGKSGSDGLLKMSEILDLKLDADWVVLSACNTGSASGQGAEAVSGLGMAFFYAGSRALLVSHWPVETNSAKTITTSIFKNIKDKVAHSKSEALAQAVSRMKNTQVFKDLATGEPLFAYAHPLFWAPFTLIGDGS